jgi:hypothetical protein
LWAEDEHLEGKEALAVVDSVESQRPKLPARSVAGAIG